MNKPVESDRTGAEVSGEGHVTETVDYSMAGEGRWIDKYGEEQYYL